ncbi:MAG: hypothetical protein DWI15_01345, partial [Planctomycetota bacterium]
TSFRPSYLPIAACLFIVIVLGVRPSLIINLNLLKGMAASGNSASISKIVVPDFIDNQVVSKRQ